MHYMNKPSLLRELNKLYALLKVPDTVHPRYPTEYVYGNTAESFFSLLIDDIMDNYDVSGSCQLDYTYIDIGSNKLMSLFNNIQYPVMHEELYYYADDWDDGPDCASEKNVLLSWICNDIHVQMRVHEYCCVYHNSYNTTVSVCDSILDTNFCNII